MITIISCLNATVIAVAESQKASPFYAFEQSDLFGRCVVALLFVASIIAWTIMIDKWFALKRTKRECSEVLKRFNDHSITGFLALGPTLSGSMGSISKAVRSGLCELMTLSPEALEALLADDETALSLCDRDLHRIRSRAESQVDAEVMEIESRLGILSSIVSASPFLGLLGTVWGVMMAFSGMAIHGKADINAIAPGVSGALLTTVVGLLVAIPAVIGYNVLVNDVKRVTVNLDNFADELLTKLEVAGKAPEGTRE